MTQNLFDPYVEWLGIRDPQRPPNHYCLLGLAEFEENARVIANAADRPNILLIYADDQSYKTISCYGDQPSWVKTPNIDAIAAEGLRFTDFHANGPVCSPTRAALLTGCYQRASC